MLAVYILNGTGWGAKCSAIEMVVTFGRIDAFRESLPLMIIVTMYSVILGMQP